jgi:heme O synthase-like polyprenyltransferase
MLLKTALIMWFLAMAISFFAKAQGRNWMARLFLGGFCLLLLAAFLKLISRAL